MGYDCGSAVSGDSLAALLAAVQQHALDHHDYSQEEVESEDMIAIWEGAIKQ
jgi:predicted small metal-binding protein